MNPDADLGFMREALRLARRGAGRTSPNPMVGAILVRQNRIIGAGWHRAAGQPHAEIEAIADARSRGFSSKGATLYVTLEPCSTHGRTPPCVDAIREAGIRRVIAAATDPNPAHAGRGFELLETAGIDVTGGVLASDATELNRAFNHWIVNRTPWVIVKAAMTLDGKIATASGESKWITNERSRRLSHTLRRAGDAILVGVNTILADDPSLTARSASGRITKVPRRIVLDSKARTPLTARVVSDAHAACTTLIVTKRASARRIRSLSRKVAVWIAPERQGRVDLEWLLGRLGRDEITHLLVEGGGEVNASFLFGGFAHRVVFFYAPKILGGRQAAGSVSGHGAENLAGSLPLRNPCWQRIGTDLMLSADVGRPGVSAHE